MDSLDIFQMWLSGYRWDGSNLVKALIHQTTANVASLVTIHRLICLYDFRKDRKGFFRSVWGPDPEMKPGINPYYFSRHSLFSGYFFRIARPRFLKRRIVHEQIGDLFS